MSVAFAGAHDCVNNPNLQMLRLQELQTLRTSDVLVGVAKCFGQV